MEIICILVWPFLFSCPAVAWSTGRSQIWSSCVVIVSWCNYYLFCFHISVVRQRVSFFVTSLFPTTSWTTEGLLDDLSIMLYFVLASFALTCTGFQGLTPLSVSSWLHSEELERAQWGWEDSNMAVSTQLGLLLWKNFTYRRRQTVSRSASNYWLLETMH